MGEKLIQLVANLVVGHIIHDGDQINNLCRKCDERIESKSKSEEL